MPVNKDKTTRLSVSLDKASAHCLQALADSERRSVAQYLRLIVEDAIQGELTQRGLHIHSAAEMELDELVAALKSQQ